MENNTHRIIGEALLRIMRPLVRVMLRYGVTYKAFAEIVKRAYVEIAYNEFRIPGRKQTDSRIAVITGLTRKEVKRVSGLEMPRDYPDPVLYNRAARVITGWTSNPDFLDDTGSPKDLPLDNEEISFAELVRRHSGDAPPRAILDELERVGAVERLGDNTLVLLTRAYIPQADDADKVAFMGVSVGQLIRTIDRNFWGDTGDVLFQRIVSNDKIPTAALPELRMLSKRKGQQLLEALDRWLVSHEARNRHGDPSDLHNAGVGLYYFEDE